MTDPQPAAAPLTPEAPKPLLRLPPTEKLMLLDGDQKKAAVEKAIQQVKDDLERKAPSEAHFIHLVSSDDDNDSPLQNAIFFGGLTMVGLFAFLTSAFRIYTLSYARMLPQLNSDTFTTSVSALSITLLTETAVILFTMAFMRTNNWWLKALYFTLAFCSALLSITGNITLGASHEPLGGFSLYDPLEWIIPTFTVLGIGPILEHQIMVVSRNASRMKKAMASARIAHQERVDSPKTHPDYQDIVEQNVRDALVELNKTAYPDVKRAPDSYWGKPIFDVLYNGLRRHVQTEADKATALNEPVQSDTNVQPEYSRRSVRRSVAPNSSDRMNEPRSVDGSVFTGSPRMNEPRSAGRSAFNGSARMNEGANERRSGGVSGYGKTMNATDRTLQYMADHPEMDYLNVQKWPATLFKEHISSQTMEDGEIVAGGTTAYLARQSVLNGALILPEPSYALPLLQSDDAEQITVASEPIQTNVKG